MSFFVNFGPQIGPLCHWILTQNLWHYQTRAQEQTSGHSRIAIWFLSHNLKKTYVPIPVFLLVIVMYIRWKVQIHIWKGFFVNRVSVFTLVTMVIRSPQISVKNEQWHKSSIQRVNELNQTISLLGWKHHSFRVSQLEILASRSNFVSVVDLRMICIKSRKKHRECMSILQDPVRPSSRPLLQGRRLS